ncbi:hypothetical protein [Sulfuricurvum sp.]|uniref:hypothetical protein n=1 Tax=Sulfuricurvum sp. TaxID=2025608 RepID=UPI003C5E7C18
MIKRIGIGALLLTSIIYAQTATTETIFHPLGNSLGKDIHGNELYKQQVTISTTNYEVNTFWNRFFDPENKTRSFTQIKTTATAQLSVEASSACSIAGKGELASQGCSGQKPFLVNDVSVAGLANEASVSLMFQPVYKDAGTPTGLYTDTSADAMIYPLDIQRDEDYYKNDVPLGAKKSFSSFFSEIFQFFFSFFGFTSQNSTDYLDSPVVKIDNVTSADDERQRYRANIIAGVQQKYLMSTGTDLHPGLLYTPVSLLHYKQKNKEENVASCQSAFWPMTMMCRIMTGFTSMFFNTTLLKKNTSGSAVKSDLITLDTENALLALAGKITPAKVQTTATSAPTSLFSGMFNWMSKMMSMMFGTTTVTATTPVYSETNYQFTDAEAMTMTLAVTKDGGATVDRFETFKLMGIHSTNAAQGSGDETCTVEKKETTYSFFFPTGTATTYETFYKSKGSTATAWSMKLQTGGFIFMPTYTTYNTHQLWVSWCAGKGVGGSSVDGGKTYTVKSYNNNGIGLGRGLILDLKKITLKPTDPLSTTQIKLITVTH